MSIITSLPFNLVNGQVADATQVDANFNQIVTQVNAGALPLSGGTLTGPLTLAGDAVAPLQPVSLEQMTAAIGTSSSGLLLNRIINGAFDIDQRLAGGVYTVTAADVYGTADRWLTRRISGGTASAQASPGGAAPGFSSSLNYTVTAGAVAGATDIARVWQKIEGLNIYDAQFGNVGTGVAQSVTLTFSVQSSIVGKMSVAIQNAAANRSYIANYTVPDTSWHTYTVTIPGDVTGTWPVTNAASLSVIFDLGSGVNFESAVGAWTASNVFRTSDSVKVSATTNATWDLDGVSLTVGTGGGGFNRRFPAQELALCQRYFWKSFPQATAPAQNAGSTGQITYQLPAATTEYFGRNPVVMRATPTCVTYNPSAANANWRDLSAGADVAATFQAGDTSEATFGISAAVSTAGHFLAIQATFSAEL